MSAHLRVLSLGGRPSPRHADLRAGPAASALQLVPCTWKTAKAFVNTWHRHHPAPVGYRYAIGVARADTLVGVAIVGRPVSRHLDDGATLEVTRTAVMPEVPDANSKLYGACWRAAKALGYQRLITYTQDGETGASLRAAGWHPIAHRPSPTPARLGPPLPAPHPDRHGADRPDPVAGAVTQPTRDNHPPDSPSEQGKHSAHDSARDSEERYPRSPFEPANRPAFRFEVVVVSGEEGAELRVEQARAIKELLEWLAIKRPRHQPER
jgi:hypothetical protein